MINNNFIAIVGGPSSSRGLYLYNVKYSEVVFNSINMYAGGSGSSGAYFSSGTNYTFKNNNIFCKYGYAIYASTLPTGLAFDYNRDVMAFPDPETPVTQVISPFGKLTSTLFRLLSVAPFISIKPCSG